MKKGWYPDPQNSQQYRWWNGDSWTEDTSDQARENLQEEGEEIELEQGAREAIERRRKALQTAGQKSSQKEPRRRRRRRQDPQEKGPSEEPVSEEKGEVEEAPTFLSKDSSPPPDFKASSAFPDIESSDQGADSEDPFPDIFDAPKEIPKETQEVASKKRSPKKEKTGRKEAKPTKRSRRKKGGASSARKILLATKKEVAHISGLIASGVKREKKEAKEGVPTKPLAWKKLLLWGGPALLVVALAGLLVFLPGDSEPEGERAVTALGEPKEKSTSQKKKESVVQCLRKDPAVRSAVFETNDSGENVWKVIFVDKNYELVTITEKASPKEALLEEKFSSTSFVAASGGRYSILGPLRGIEGSGIKTSPRLLEYISSLETCLGRIN